MGQIFGVVVGYAHLLWPFSADSGRVSTKLCLLRQPWIPRDSHGLLSNGHFPPWSARVGEFNFRVGSLGEPGRAILAGPAAVLGEVKGESPGFQPAKQFAKLPSADHPESPTSRTFVNDLQLPEP